MARVSKQQMALNRESIVQTSSQLFRARGLNGVSVNDLMAAVGLTHGGFYGHFTSKDELAAIASRKALDDSSTRWQQISSQPEHHNLRTLVELYLSTTHRDHAEDGCAITALASDVARENDENPVREVYLSGVRSLLDRLMSVSDIENEEQRRQHALAQLAMLSGALTLARATAGDKLSDEFLEAAKKVLLTEEK
ncbi:TetR/AcrR family transcriptional regulator [Yersinia sp. 2544 StPb PI]|uniref:TetR/AcrR family transcriptional regulator n=1 Tax=unclassified Yersinia (in: enterobacteria) TaxID=2653513 RepID=UPI0009F5F999|nr:TetR/AcrR family transcriptional regulator [Yersinia enterocolitica]